MNKTINKLIPPLEKHRVHAETIRKQNQIFRNHTCYVSFKMFCMYANIIKFNCMQVSLTANKYIGRITRCCSEGKQIWKIN